MITQKKAGVLIISLIISLVLVTSALAYYSGAFGWLFGEKELEAKKSNYPQYIERFRFDGIDFVQNVALAVPTPETVKTYPHLDGALTLRHNDSRAKIIYIDTPSRVSLSADDSTFLYSQIDIPTGNNESITRYKLHLQPQKEYTLYYKILNVNEFIDRTGEVSFTLKDLEETKERTVTTKFLSTLDEYEDISLGINFQNLKDNHFAKEINEKVKIYFNERELITRSSISIDGVFSLDVKPLSYTLNLYTPPTNQWRFSEFNSDLPLIVEINNDEIKIGSKIYTFKRKSYGNILRLGGHKDRVEKTFSYSLYGDKIMAGNEEPLCKMNGFDSVIISAYTKIWDNNYRYITGDSWELERSPSANIITALTCKNEPFNDDREIILIDDSYMKMPYLLDSSKTIKLPQNFSEIKIYLKEGMKTLEFVYDETNKITTFSLPEELTFKEFEIQRLDFLIDTENKSIPIYYDPNKNQKALWEMFERKVQLMGGN